MAEPLNACSLAASVDACESGAGAPADGLHGQMGTVHIFDGVLKPGAAPLHFCDGLPSQLHGATRVSGRLRVPL